MAGCSGRKGNWVPDYTELFSRREEWRCDMRARVLDTAAALLDEVGPRQFTVKEVARRAGVGRTSLYKHFGIKAELLAACRDHVAYRRGHGLDGRALAHARSARPTTTPLRPALAQVWRVLVGLAEEMKAEGDLWLLAAAEGVRSKRRPPHHRVWEPPSPFPFRLLGLVRRELQAAQQAGEVPEGTDLAALARWLCALWWYDLSVRGPRQDELPDGATHGVAAAVAYLLRGICAA